MQEGILRWVIIDHRAIQDNNNFLVSEFVFSSPSVSLSLMVQGLETVVLYPKEGKSFVQIVELVSYCYCCFYVCMCGYVHGCAEGLELIGSPRAQVTGSCELL